MRKITSSASRGLPDSRKENYLMDFFGFPFIFRFLPLFLLFYCLIPDAYKNHVLFLGSLIFYAFLSLPSVPVLLIMIELNYFLARRMQSWGKRALTIGLILNLSLFLFYKFAPFSMPGVSFFSVQMIAFLIDAYYKRETDFSSFRTFAVMFPKLISGPITSYKDVASVLKGKKRISENVEIGFELFILGLSYKALLADRLAGLWHSIQTIGFASISFPLAWLGIIGFSLQLYLDFQGYSLMAIGLGRILGFTLPDNFDSPYCSRSVSEFYRRWHMSLGRFFKEYVYIPLGGNKHGIRRTLLNILAVWLLTAMWHGFKLNYLLWGLFIFIFIALEKLFLMKYLEKSRVLSHIYLIFVITLSWVFFTITKVQDIAVYMSRLFEPIVRSAGVNVYSLDYIKYGKMYGPFLIAAIFFSLPITERLIKKYSGKWQTIFLLFIFFWLSIYEMAINTNNPFMYFKF